MMIATGSSFMENGMSADMVYEKLVRPLLFKIDPESAHRLAQFLMKTAAPILPALGFQYKKADLHAELFGSSLSNPIGLAAGFDKNAMLVPLHAALGFAYAEIGSVCARPHGGNPRPRLFRLPEDAALINRLGLNGLGAEAVARNLAAYDNFPLPIAVNIAKTNDPNLSGEAAVQDIVYSFDCIKSLPIKYVTLNTSCPNTTEGCLKESSELDAVLKSIEKKNTDRIPLLLKLSPDSSLEFIEDLVKLAGIHKVAGFVCGNTTLKREGLVSSQTRLAEIGKGGLSGRPLKEQNLKLTRMVASLKSKDQIIIGVGGIMTGADAFDYLCAGAHLLQIYTSLVYRGPSVVKLICAELSQILDSRGLSLASLRSQLDLSSREDISIS